MLAIQSLMGALAIGANAAFSPLGVFGNVICISHGAESPSGTDAPSANHRMPDCCLAGCSMFAPVLMPPAHAGRIIERPAQPAAVIVAARLRHPVSGGKGSPGNPRAPPLTA